MSINSYPPDFRQVGNDLYLLGITSLRSSDNGLSWSAPPTGSQVFSSFIQRHQNVLWMQPGFFYRSTHGLNRSHFQPNGLPPQIYDWSNMAEIQGKLFVTGGTSFNDKVFRSDDGGANWSEVFDYAGSGSSRIVADINQQRLYYLVKFSTTNDLYVSADLGTSWQQINDPNPPFDAFVAKGDTIFFIGQTVLHYSYDGGSSWQSTAFNADMGAAHQNDLILTGDGRLIVSKRVNKSAYLTTDWGQTYIQTLQAPSYFLSLSQLDSLSIFNLNSWPYTSNGVYLSNNSGVSGVTFTDSAWLNASSFLIKDGYLYGSGYPFQGVIRMELQPLLDGLQYQQFGTALMDIYLDRNQNCLHDPGEEGVPEQTIVFQPGDFLATTGTDGLIRRVLPVQSYNLNILLPDSSTNEPASHGYILFSIAAKNNVLPGDTLINQASIYFDINRPVLTNTTKTAVFNPAGGTRKPPAMDGTFRFTAINEIIIPLYIVGIIHLPYCKNDFQSKHFLPAFSTLERFRYGANPVHQPNPSAQPGSTLQRRSHCHSRYGRRRARRYSPHERR